MNSIYNQIAKLTSRFKKIAARNTNDENEINECVQELMLYFLQMTPKTLKKIWDKDGETGIIKYGTIIINRSLTSKTSPYYYKYKKYYTHIDSVCFINNKTTNILVNDSSYYNNKNVYNLPEQDNEKKYKKLELIDSQLDKLHWYDEKLFKLYYYEGNTLDSLAAKTKISRNSIFSTIDKVRNILKKTLNE